MHSQFIRPPFLFPVRGGSISVAVLTGQVQLTGGTIASGWAHWDGRADGQTGGSLFGRPKMGVSNSC